jgi:hypothetical protein
VWVDRCNGLEMTWMDAIDEDDEDDVSLRVMTLDDSSSS